MEAIGDNDEGEHDGVGAMKVHVVWAAGGRQQEEVVTKTIEDPLSSFAEKRSR